MEEFSKLVAMLEALRGEHGCPWDRKQTIKEFKTYLLEEVYELVDAIEKEDYGALQEELGDLLFHIVFISQICREKGVFDIGKVVAAVYEKMYRRHPHVFGNATRDVPVEKRWEDIKREEKDNYSPLGDVPRMMPALLRAYVISRRAARTGFDWPRLEDVYQKMAEEVEELKEAESSGSPSAVREEIGDLLFTVANIARFQGVDPEDALRFTCDKFVRRFTYMEEKTDLAGASATTMDALWNEAKKSEKRGE